MTDLLHNLETRVAAAPSPRIKVQAMNDLIWELRHRDPRRALSLAEEACTIASDANDTTRYCDSLCSMALIHNRLAQYAQAMRIALEAMVCAEDDSLQQSNALSVMGIAHMRLGNYSEGLECLLRSLKIAETLDDPFLIGHARNGIGGIYYNMGEYEKALDQFEQIIQLTNETRPGDTTLAMLISNIATCHIKLGNYDRALDYENQSLALSREWKLIRAEAFVLHRIGEIHTLTGEYDLAAENLTKALVMADSVGARDVMVNIQINYGNLYEAQGDYPAMLERYQTALKLAEAIDARPLLTACHEKLAAAYKQLGDYKNALDHYERFTAYREEIHDLQLDTRVKSLQTLHDLETAQQQAAIYQLEAAAHEQRAVQVEEQLQKAQLRLKLEKEHELGEMKNRLMMTIAHQFRTPLTIIQNAAYMLDNHLDRLTEEKRLRYTADMRSQVQRLRQMLNDMSLVLKHTYGQMNMDMTPVNLTALLEAIVHRLTWQHQSADRITLKAPANPPQVIVDGDLIRRIVNELLTNALKFTTGPVVLKLDIDDNGITVVVTDEGPGIPLEEQSQMMEPFFRSAQVENVPGTGLGLTVVQDCVTLQNGDLTIHSDPEAGTTVTVHLPVFHTAYPELQD
jgi:signal transduction histidine kinase